MTCRDEAAPLAIKGVASVVAVTVMGGGLGDLGHISGRGYLAIPAHPVLSRLPWTAPGAQEWQDNLFLRYGLDPPDLPH